MSFFNKLKLKTDIFRKGIPLYNVERHIVETNEAFGDGAHIMYVNGECRDETPLGRLMQDFSCTDPENMNYQALADRTGYFKRDEKGVNIMCRLLEDMRMEAMQEGIEVGKREGKKEGIEVGKKEGVLNTVRCLIADGTLSLEKIAAFAGLTYDEVKTIAKNK